MSDLAVTLCGLKLQNPLVLASGPLSWNAVGSGHGQSCASHCLNGTGEFAQHRGLV
jgi:dihydroorotate dehydrogenase